MLARRIYNFSIAGAAGGFVGSLLHQYTVLDTLAKSLPPRERYILLGLLGAMVGASIGFVPRFAEGLGQYSFVRALRRGLLGAFLGALGGLVTLPPAEWVHSHMDSGMLGRALAWALLGLSIGFAEGLTGGARQWRGLVGGSVGGLLAGILLETLVAQDSTHAVSGILALLIVGLFISLCVALFVNVLSEVWLEGLPGSKVDGQIYHLSKFRGGREAFLGSDKKEDLLVWVYDAEPQHAAIALRSDAAVLRNLSVKAPTRVAGSAVADQHVLQDGEIIEIGSARLRYRERRRALRMRPPARAALFFACLLGLGSGVSVFASEDHSCKVQITQIDKSAFPKVRIFVSVTDKNGNPISSAHRVALAVFENSHRLASYPLSTGWKVSSILALDASGSMDGEKIIAAREAAKVYVDHAPPFYEIAVVVFSDRPELVQDFTSDKQLLKSRIAGITTGGQTALQDTVGFALGRLAGRSGRKSVVLLTDGQENASLSYKDEAGRTRLQQRSAAEDVTVSMIGLGSDVKGDYLKAMTANGGRYRHAPQANELQSAFLEQANILKKEHVLEIESRSRDADGLRRNLKVELGVDDGPCSEDTGGVKPPGVLPHVPGDHKPYAMALAILLVAPGVAGTARVLFKVARFRRKHLQRLRPGSALLGTTEINSGDRFEAGDLVVLCPYSRTPHYPRSWRLNRCRCMREPGCAGAFCYQQVLPRWLRTGLGRITARRMAETGRRWLCHCQGDREGY